MRQRCGGLGAFALLIFSLGCGSSDGNGAGGSSATSTGSSSNTSGSSNSGASSSSGSPLVCPDAGAPKGIAHVVIIVQENHTFDAYFGHWCTAATGSNPTCTSGPSCCEAAPAKDPTGASPVTLDDTENAAYDPSHLQACELTEIDNGKMDGFVTGSGGSDCQSADNFAYAPASVTQPYLDLASKYAIADRYFQPIAGQSSSNDMYLAVAKEVFIDNAYEPKFAGSQCELSPTTTYTGQTTIADLLINAGKTVNWYSEGFSIMEAAGANCPMAPAACGINLPLYPCVFDPGDVPFVYYSQFASSTTFVKDYTQLAKDVAANALPDVSYVKGIGYHSEHPGYGTTISEGVTFVSGVISTIEESCYANDTLILLTWDEGGGFFDHVAPPAKSTVDNQPYGTRIPLLAIGPFAKKGEVSHVQMEHSSIVKFLEWNYLDGKTGQLNARDAVVNNIGSLLDPTAVGETVPSN